MIPLASYKSLMLFAIAALIIGLGFLAIKHPLGIHKTFSQHAAVKKSLIIYYAALFIITLIPLNLFFIFWFTPTFQTSQLFIIFIIASSIFQILCTFIPETSGWRISWHRLLAGVSALLLLPAIVVLFYTNSIILFGKIICLFSIVAMVAVIAAMITTQKRPTYSLLLQIIYFTAFFTPILFISYFM